MASFEASQVAMYSALHVELATVFCFRAAQDTIPDPSEKQ
jgi:hypothetical protein